ncbi:P-loop containing nucleoside triphosphate hydrolase protein [Mycena sanguinolenta]|nr:P-loop containing nucleoside triphosphate hydrolase protein [Mycena sanguinolenta]
MHNSFSQDTGKQKIYVLYGLGGAGKTQVALKFIEKWTRFSDRILVDASTPQTIEAGLSNIAAEKQTGNSMQDGINWLLGNQEEWLLFFDNADDPDLNLNQFFPKCNHGNIIITTRNPNLRGAHSQMSDMEESEAVILLLKSAHQDVSEPNKLVAQEIVKALWYLPLAIVQAGAFIAESGNLGTYLDFFTKNHIELLNKRPTQSHDDYAWAVYTTWEMSFHKLTSPAAMFLQLCSFLHRDEITEEIFSRAAKQIITLQDSSHREPKKFRKLKSKLFRIFLPGSSQSGTSLSLGIENAKEFLSQFIGTNGEWDSFCFLKTANEIKAYLLISFHVERKSFSIHLLAVAARGGYEYFSCLDFQGK